VFGLLNCLLVGLTTLGIVLAVNGAKLRWSPPPRPAGWEAPQRTQPRPMANGRHQASSAEPMGRSLPVTVAIPAIHVSARVIPVGLTPAGSIAVPPLAHPFLAGWYDTGPVPGQQGAAVIVGHVDAASVGPAVFYDLGRLRPGQRVFVTLADGRTAIFAVSGAALYSKASFPASMVYAPTRQPTLRLITCGGAFDSRTGHYLASVVVYADYAGQQAAPKAAAPKPAVPKPAAPKPAAPKPAAPKQAAPRRT